ncbi:MAG TPA: MEDS domain-containing protein [Gemmatimonadales bacterium]|nr:MEDS domain-containing protein [Gemmatimonadales bacterium]
MSPLAREPDVEASRHKCLIYEGHPSEQLPVIVPLLIEGLREGRRCLYLGDPGMLDMVASALSAKGVDVKAETERGALILSSDRSHLNDGFDPEAMVAMLTTLIDDAVRDGYQGLCATGDMRWELGPDKNFDRLLEYEALLERVFRDKPLSGVCQYHAETVPGRAIQDALLAHRSLYVGHVLHRDNVFYVPPEVLLASPETRDKQGEWMCQQITRILKAERRRDDALAALRESEAEQRRLAVALAAANIDLERRVQERTTELQAVNQELEAFSYSVSHDLRAPLRHIDGFSRILAEDFGPLVGVEGRRLVERIQSGVSHMNELILGMLTLARVTRTEARRETVDLSALAEASAAGLRKNDPARTVEVVIHKDLRVTGDPALLRAAIENLLGNAWKFTSRRPDARIEVGRRSDERDTVFFVADNGAGFDPAQADRLFGVFQRLHTTDEYPGTGVGLATVKRIVVRHGGRIWATGRPDEGATFSFTLPAS